MVKELQDYVDEVQKKFPIFTKQEINKILTYGLKSYAWTNKMRADVLIFYQDNENFIAHCGPLGFDSLKHYYRYNVKQRMRQRVLSKLKKEKWDGYYYIGLTEEQQQQTKKRGKKVTFKNVYLTKLLKELHHTPYIEHIWKVPWVDDCGWKFFVKKLQTDKAEYLGKNQYAKYHQCFLERDVEGYASFKQQLAESNRRAECNNDNL